LLLQSLHREGDINLSDSTAEESSRAEVAIHRKNRKKKGKSLLGDIALFVKKLTCSVVKKPCPAGMGKLFWVGCGCRSCGVKFEIKGAISKGNHDRTPNWNL
jgi:hypothetical protein